MIARHNDRKRTIGKSEARIWRLNRSSDKFLARHDRIAARAGKESGIITANGFYLTEAAGKGVDMFCVGSELNLVSDGVKAVVERIEHLK